MEKLENSENYHFVVQNNGDNEPDLLCSESVSKHEEWKEWECVVNLSRSMKNEESESV